MVDSIKQLLAHAAKPTGEPPITLLLSNRFMKLYTGYSSWQELSRDLGVNTICEDELEKAIAAHNHLHSKIGFTNWTEMKCKAVDCYYEERPFGIVPHF
ncbi:hypothetical protein [Halalkalibacter oceani]|uniref:Uncharacterized protein n=1 Tax=Halalkalibacter oceani TaxID=1653776 RepID=A0A9X2DM04_9BACI|nr:hypothetical protein [Halalkalibacter oceani]MCM3713039.1 hypothetical protein [Halalkalibacter oceani]